MTPDIAKRAAAFITERDPFGDHFSAHDLAQLDPDGGFVAVYFPPVTVPANEQEAQRGLNDTFPGDAYPVVGVLQEIRQRSVQAIHAGISRRDWHATEAAANELRDKMDDLIRRLAGAR